MASRVYLHVGLPKTATTYLQTIAWDNRDVLRRLGVLLPGEARHDHLWSSRVVREDEPFAAVSSPHRLAAWDRVRADVEDWPGTALVSHEFFAAATAEQAARAVAQLAPAQVHLVVTAREPLGLFTASWQESIKNRDVRTIEEYAATDDEESGGVWNWRTLDLRLVLERWGPTVPPERVHVLPLARSGGDRRQVWDRFAGLLGIDPDAVSLDQSFPNASMGVVEAETLRRMNAHLGEFNRAVDRGTYIRSFLADERLVPRGGDRYWPPPPLVEDARQRGRAAFAHVVGAGYDVVGDVEDLLVPEELPQRRTPDSVTDAEVAEVAVWLAARMLHDVRDLRHERRALREEVALWRGRASRPGLRRAVATRWPGLRRRVLPDEDAWGDDS